MRLFVGLTVNTIPQSSIIAMIACIALVVVIPVLIAIFLIRRYTMNLSAIILGIMAFVVFDTIFLGIFDSIVLGQASAVIRDLVNSTPLSYTAYYAFIHALFYTAAFSVALRMILNQDTGVGTGIAVGLGFGGASAVLGAAYPMFNNVVAALQINKIGSEAFLAEAEESNRQVLTEMVGKLVDSSASDLILSGYQKILLFLIFVAAAVVIHLAITHRSSFSYLFAAMAALFIVYIPPALYSTGVITSVLVLNAVMTVLALLFVLFAVSQTKKFGQNPLRY